jgi:plastocyanin
MKSLLRRATPLLLLVFLIPAPAGAGATIEVEVGDPFFWPRDITVRTGDDVHWTRDDPSSTIEHNIREDNKIFYSGQPTHGTIDYRPTFSAGTFYYFCEVHGRGNMDGYVRVVPAIKGEPKGLPFKVRWAADATNTGSVYDVQYRVGSGDWHRWKKDTGSVSGVFGRNGKPVSVRSGKKYSFRARSGKDSASSDWSPRKSFTP